MKKTQNIAPPSKTIHFFIVHEILPKPFSLATTTIRLPEDRLFLRHAERFSLGTSVKALTPENLNYNLQFDTRG